MRQRLGLARWMGVTALLVAATLTLVGVAGAVANQATAGPQPKIVGGSETKADEHPYVVYLADRRGKQYCGGTLITPDKVVTAAHCVARSSPRRISVVAGRQDTRTDEGTVVEVADMWVHEDYSSVTDGNDIAVLTLEEKVPYETIRPAKAEDEAQYDEGTKATILGWGRIAERGPSSNQLREARVPLRTDEHCEETYRDYQPEQMVCAGYKKGGVDACQGDSGGPLIAGGRLIGVVSWGEGCARPDKPGVYTEVRAFEAEIKDAVAGSRRGTTPDAIGIPILGG